MAFPMMGGIIAGTAITLAVVPALYLAVFRVKQGGGRSSAPRNAAGLTRAPGHGRLPVVTTGDRSCAYSP
ncbi:hypothetical protein [Salipiger aestuarii]|uniref:hypothetical protein n=1 Tax=Salipiger aestuarii TaxID=568098 RepID=UPI00124F37FD|nr:hypothetical protein [Salipiger aestuarii]